MAEAFERGMSSLLSSSTAPQDPVQMAKAASDLFSSPVPNVQALITGARAGDMQAARSLREKMGERLAPGRPNPGAYNHEPTFMLLPCPSGDYHVKTSRLQFSY